MVLHWISRRYFVLPAVFLLGLVFPAVVAADVDLCIGGDANGSWNLPSSVGGRGSANGVLVAGGSDQPLYYLAATLNEHSYPMEFRIGKVKGHLYDPNDPLLTPQYVVRGSWRTAFRDYSQGTWQAQIMRLYTGEVVGEISGTFAIPASRDGTFSGEWDICEHP